MGKRCFAEGFAYLRNPKILVETPKGIRIGFGIFLGDTQI